MTIVCATATTTIPSQANEEPMRAAAALARSAHHRLVLASVKHDAAQRRAWLFLRGSELLLRGDHTLTIPQLLIGAEDEAVARLCDEVRARLLVVGAGQPPLERWHATRVDRLAFSVRVPTLVVRDAAPFVAWSEGEAPLRVLLIVDSTETRAASVLLGDGERAWLGAIGWRALETVTDELWHTDELRERHGFDPIPCADSAEAIVEVAAREDVDLIVFATHRKEGLSGLKESIAHEVIATTTAAVALVPEPPVGPVA